MKRLFQSLDYLPRKVRFGAQAAVTFGEFPHHRSHVFAKLFEKRRQIISRRHLRIGQGVYFDLPRSGSNLAIGSSLHCGPHGPIRQP